MHMSGSAIASYEQGRRYPDVNAMKKLADYFDVSIDYLYERTDNPCSIKSIDRELSVMNLFYKIPKTEQDLFIQLMKIVVSENELKLKCEIEKKNPE